MSTFTLKSSARRLAILALAAAVILPTVMPAAAGQWRGKRGYAAPAPAYGWNRQRGSRGNGAALAAIAGIAALGIGAAIASSSRQQAYGGYGQSYGYGETYAPVYGETYGDVDEDAYARAPAYAPAPVYGYSQPRHGYGPPHGGYGRHVSRRDWQRLRSDELRDANR